MSSYNYRISTEDREHCTVPPPPELKRDGTMVQLYPLGVKRYNDLMFEKQGMTVFIDEELDAYDHPGSLRHYRMMIRCLPHRHDINIVLAAARHMLLVSKYEVAYEEREGLDPTLERGYWDVRYEIARDQMRADDDTHVNVDIYVPYMERRRIWMELFEAMGYRVKWGSSVLNVRRRK